MATQGDGIDDERFVSDVVELRGYVDAPAMFRRAAQEVEDHGVRYFEGVTINSEDVESFRELTMRLYFFKHL